MGVVMVARVWQGGCDDDMRVWLYDMLQWCDSGAEMDMVRCGQAFRCEQVSMF